MSGLLNIGSEEIKGNETLKNTNSLLNQLNNNFIIYWIYRRK